MSENKLRKFIDDKEYERIITERDSLQEDLEFFKLYIKRNKTSRFGFELTPTSGVIGTRLMKKLYEDYYKYNISDLHIMLTEILVVRNMMHDLNGDCLWTPDAVSEIKQHFFENYEINLKDHISDFIHCSRSCDKVWDRLM